MGVGSFFALNRVLLFKWVWRFRTNQASLWAHVVKAVHWENALLNFDTLPQRRSVWIEIIQIILNLRAKGINLFDYCKKLIGNGDNTRFVLDVWLGEIPLIDGFPCLFLLETKKMFRWLLSVVILLGWILFAVLLLVEPRVSRLLCFLSFVIQCP